MCYIDPAYETGLPKGWDAFLPPTIRYLSPIGWLLPPGDTFYCMYPPKSGLAKEGSRCSDDEDCGTAEGLGQLHCKWYRPPVLSYALNIGLQKTCQRVFSNVAGEDIRADPDQMKVGEKYGPKMDEKVYDNRGREYDPYHRGKLANFPPQPKPCVISLMGVGEDGKDKCGAELVITPTFAEGSWFWATGSLAYPGTQEYGIRASGRLTMALRPDYNCVKNTGWGENAYDYSQVAGMPTPKEPTDFSEPLPVFNVPTKPKLEPAKDPEAKDPKAKDSKGFGLNFK